MKNKRVCSNPDRTFKLFVGTLFLFFALSFFIVMIIGADLKLTPDQPQPPTELETYAVIGGGDVGNFNLKLANLNYDQLKSFFNTPLVKDNIGKIYPKLSEDFTSSSGRNMPNLKLGAWMMSDNQKSFMSKLDEKDRMNLVNKVLVDDSKMSSEEKTKLSSERVKAVELSLKEEFKDIQVDRLPKDIQLKIVKGSDGKLKHSLEYIGKDGKPNGEIALNQKIKRIYSDKEKAPQLDSKTNQLVDKNYLMLDLTKKDASGKVIFQTLEIGPGLNMNEKMGFSYEGSKKDTEINLGYSGSRVGGSSFTLQLEKGADGKNNLGITVVDSQPQAYKTLADMGKDIANTPSVLIGDSKSGYLFVQPQGEGGKNGEMSFNVDSNGKIAITDGRARFAVTMDGYDPSKTGDQFVGYSMSVGEGKIVNLDRTRDLASPEKFVKGSNEITIGKNGIVVNNNFDKSSLADLTPEELSKVPVRDPVTINDFSKQLEHKIYAYGNDEIKYYENTGNLWTHMNSNDITQWIQGEAQISVASDKGVTRVEKGSTQNILDMDIDELGNVPIKGDAGSTTEKPAETTKPETTNPSNAGSRGIKSVNVQGGNEEAPAKVEIDTEGVDISDHIEQAIKEKQSTQQPSSSSSETPVSNPQTSPEKQKAVLDAVGSGFSASPSTTSTETKGQVKGFDNLPTTAKNLINAGHSFLAAPKEITPTTKVAYFYTGTNSDKGSSWCKGCNSQYSNYADQAKANLNNGIVTVKVELNGNFQDKNGVSHSPPHVPYLYTP